MIDLTGKAALVTGGSRGIGKAIALRLARQGADVAFSYKGNADAAKATAAEIESIGTEGAARSRATSGSPSRPTRVVKAALEAFGKVDILVNNAGITRDDLIMRMSEDAWRDVLETNLFGAFWMTKAVTRPMLKARARPDRQHHVGVGPGRPDGPGELLVGKGRADRADQGDGARARVARHHRQRRRTRLRADRADQGPARGAAGRDHRRARRSGGSARPRRSPTPSRSSRRTRPAYITGQVLAVDGGLVMM